MLISMGIRWSSNTIMICQKRKRLFKRNVTNAHIQHHSPIWSLPARRRIWTWWGMQLGYVRYSKRNNSLMVFLWRFSFIGYLCGVSQTKETYINISKGGFLYPFDCVISKDISCSFSLVGYSSIWFVVSLVGNREADSFLFILKFHQQWPRKWN